METQLRQKLESALKPDVLDIVNESALHAGHKESRDGGNTHFRMKIVSSAFAPLSRIERHRLVHDILKEELKGPIHALSLTLLAPEEYTHDT